MCLRASLYFIFWQGKEMDFPQKIEQQTSLIDHPPKTDMISDYVIQMMVIHSFYVCFPSNKLNFDGKEK